MTRLLNLVAESAGWTATLLLLRTAPLAIVLPVFGGPAVSPAVRGGVVLVLCAVLWPAGMEPIPADGAVLIGTAASQLAFGLLTALGTLFVFEAARMAGSIADTVLGRGSFGASDPLARDASGPLATFHALLLLAVFGAVGGHRLVVAALARGVEVFPLGTSLSTDALRDSVALAVDLASGAFAAAVALALPALAAGFIVDVSLGWLSRTMPRLPVLFVAMPLRMVLGWTVVAATVGGAAGWLAGAVIDAVRTMTGA